MDEIVILTKIPYTEYQHAPCQPAATNFDEKTFPSQAAIDSLRSLTIEIPPPPQPLPSSSLFKLPNLIHVNTNEHINAREYVNGQWDLYRDERCTL
jgi:hypothetical protein